MKIKAKLLRTNQELGSVLVVTLLISVILGIALASYFVLVQHENVSTLRSQAWNRSIVVTEAGVEEAMALINKYSGTQTMPQQWTNSTATDGWSTIGANVYYARRYIDSDYYDAYITNLNDNPTIKCTGKVAWQYLYAAATQPFVATVGADSPGAPTSSSRAVLVTTTRSGPFFGGILTKKGIILSGGMVINSFNSQDPNYSTNGMYDPAKYRDGGDIATIETNITSAVSGSGGAKVYGHVATGPNSTADAGTSSWGDKAWVNGNNQGIEPGWLRNDMNVSIPDAPAAGFTGLPIAKTLVNVLGTNYDYYLTSGNYQVSSLSVQGGDALIVQGNVKLLITGNYTVGGSGFIYIPPGSSLTCWVGGKATVSGGGTVNGTGFATNCTYYGLPSCASFTLSGSSDFIGTVYAPEAAFTMSGGSGGQLFVGSIVAASANISGGYAFHYDESLGGQTAGSYYRMVSWKEVAP